MADARRKTVETMKQHLQVFIELKGDLPVSKLSKPLVRAFIKELKTTPPIATMVVGSGCRWPISEQPARSPSV